MRIPKLTLLLLAVLALVTPAAMADGKIVVMNDEWTFSDSGYNAGGQSATFLTNIIHYFGGTNYRADSSNFGLTGSQMNATLAGNGITYSAGSPGAFTLVNLQNYDALFFAGAPEGAFDANILAQYVHSGGNVLVEAGAGGFPDAAAGEAAFWNVFLTQFGLSYASSYNNFEGVIPIVSSDPLMAGVTGLFELDGQNINLQIGFTSDHVLASRGGVALYASYDGTGTDTPTGVPEPATLSLMGLGTAALVRRMKKHHPKQ